MKLFIFVLLLVALVSVNGKRHCVGECQKSSNSSLMHQYYMPIKQDYFDKCKAAGECPQNVRSTIGAEVPCDNGRAGDYDCLNVDLLSHITPQDLGAGNVDGNDIWGWTDPKTNDEYAIMLLESGTSFVDVTDPVNPLVMCFMPTTTSNSIWRDAKVHLDHAFVVSEASNHGMQVFNLTRLTAMTGVVPGSSVPTCSPDTVYSEFGSTHNIVINEQTGFAYAVGTRTCNSGLHIVDISVPQNPQFAGCYGDDGYVHDAQCVVYNGPDSNYRGNEICFCYNENTLTVVDVTDKNNFVMLSRTGYSGSAYTHQGWLTKDERYVLLDDELDEYYAFGPNADRHTKTYVWDMLSLTSPNLIYVHKNERETIDHNLYILEDRAFQANYASGLRVLDVQNIAESLTEIAYFDCAPDYNGVTFNGAWSNYPYFASGNIILSSIERGLFTLRLTV